MRVPTYFNNIFKLKMFLNRFIERLFLFLQTSFDNDVQNSLSRIIKNNSFSFVIFQSYVLGTYYIFTKNRII